MVPDFKKLEKIAEHLEGDDLGLDTFDFNVLLRRNHCGTMGCAIGEFPFIFPKDFYIERNSVMAYKNANPFAEITSVSDGMASSSFNVEKFLNIPYSEFNHLFIPHGQNLAINHVLSGDASKQQVANNIRHYIEFAKSYKLFWVRLQMFLGFRP